MATWAAKLLDPGGLKSSPRGTSAKVQTSSILAARFTNRPGYKFGDFVFAVPSGVATSAIASGLRSGRFQNRSGLRPGAAVSSVRVNDKPARLVQPLRPSLSGVASFCSIAKLSARPPSSGALLAPSTALRAARGEKFHLLKLLFALGTPRGSGARFSDQSSGRAAISGPFSFISGTLRAVDQKRTLLAWLKDPRILTTPTGVAVRRFKTAVLLPKD